MTQRRVTNVLTLFLVIFFMVPGSAFAAGTILPPQIVPCGNADQRPCTVCDLANLAQNILNTGIYIAVFLSAILFAWAGWLYLTGVAGSDLSRAKEIFFNVTVGLVIILIGWLVVDVLIRTLAGGSFTSWNKICELLLQHASALV